jgi:hypothetical protein
MYTINLYRKAWKEYFEAEGSIRVAFWSALAQSDTSTSHSDSALESATDAAGGGEEAESGRTAVSDDASAVSQDITASAGSDACRLLTREELTQQLLAISPVPQGQVTTVGMVKIFRMFII